MSTAKTLFKPLLIASFALAAAMGSSAWAQPTPAEDIAARYESDMKDCKTMKGNEYDVCKKAAESRRDSAIADSKANKKTSEARHDAVKEKLDSEYRIAKEKCDAMSGDAKDQCIAQAKTQFGK